MFTSLVTVLRIGIDALVDIGVDLVLDIGVLIGVSLSNYMGCDTFISMMIS